MEAVREAVLVHGVAAVAYAAQVQRQTVYRWVRGDTVPAADKLHALVDAGMLTRAQAAAMVPETVRRLLSD